MTERAVNSWERYASWVNMKTGPTGKERYISYGMYEVYDVGGLLKEAHRMSLGLKPNTPKLRRDHEALHGRLRGGGPGLKMGQ